MRLVTIPEAHNSLNESVPSIKGKLTWLSRYTEREGKGQYAGKKQSTQFGKLEDDAGNYIKIRFSDLLGAVNRDLVSKEIMFQCHDSKSHGYTGVKVKVNANKDGSKETILSITKTATFFEDHTSSSNSEPQPEPRFNTAAIKSMEKQHTNGSSHSIPSVNSVRENAGSSAVDRRPSTMVTSSLTDAFNPNQLIAIRDQAARLSKETVSDSFLKRLYCELAVAADNLNSKLLNSKF
jgi:hypothetical protein